jgi:hypothetical protein
LQLYSDSLLICFHSFHTTLACAYQGEQRAIAWFCSSCTHWIVDGEIPFAIGIILEIMMFMLLLNYEYYI